MLKHLLVSGLYAPAGGWFSKLAAVLLQGVAIDVPAFAPVTGYVSFFALALYVAGLLLIAPVPVLPSLPVMNKLAIREDALSESVDLPE